MKSHLILAIGVLVCAAVSLPGASGRRDPQRLPADNSRQNRQVVRTAQNQSNERLDRLTAAKLRRLLVADDTLSVYGKNIKIIVAGGKVTLEGPVHSHNEMLEIAFDAATVIDARCIDDRLTVA